MPAGSRLSLSSLLLALALAAAAVGPARGELVEQGNLRIDVDAQISPKRLPRHGSAPVSVSMAAELATTDGARPPQLSEITLDVNRHGRMFNRGLPTCPRARLDYATTDQALAACRRALVGRGHVSAQVALPEQAPLPSEGELLAFNGRAGGARVIYAHVFGATPLPITLVVPFTVQRTAGEFGTRLTATLPHVAADWGYVTSFQMTLGRRYRQGGHKRSYLSAGCPAPAGFPGALFTLAQASYSFDDGRQLTSSLVRSCKVRR